MPDFIFKDSFNVTPELIILNTNFFYYEFCRKAGVLGVGGHDVNEIIWQIFDLLYTADDEKTKKALNVLPNYQRLSCKHLLEDWYKEKTFKEATIEFALSLHEIIKNLGMYHHETDHEQGFPYTYYKLINGMIVVKTLFS